MVGGNKMNSIKKGLSIFVIALLVATSTVPTIEVQTVQAKTKYVYITTSGRGKKYHINKYCRTLRRSRVKRIKKSKAKRCGYKACKVCTR